MSQYCSRLHIKVSSPKIWKKFEDVDDASFDLAELAETNRTSFIIDDWSSMEDELTGIVEALAETLGPDGIIISDTTNINVDPYNYCIFYLGDSVRTDEFSIFGDEEKGEMHFETNISDIPGWLSYGEFYISKEEKEQLFRCGIAFAGGHFKEFSTNLDLPTKIYLRETSFKNRPNNIEKTFITEEVFFVHAKDSYDPMRLEVMNDLGSLGYLPSDVSDAISPAMLNKRLTYTAKVVDLVKLSNRNKHAKSPIIAISIEAEIVDKDVPMKTSVPKINRNALAETEKKKFEEVLKIEEERKRKEVEERKAEEERKRQEEERRQQAIKAEEERKRKEAEERKAEEERKRQEEERRQQAIKAEEERRRKETEERKAEEERKRQEERRRHEKELLKKKYAEELDSWKKECTEIKVKRTTEVSKQLAAQKSNLEASAKQKLDATIKTAKDKKIEYTKRKSEAEAILSSLGFFKFESKKIQKANIEIAIKMISEAEAEIKCAEETYRTEISKIALTVTAMESQIVQRVEKEMPLPTEPKKPAF